MKPTHSPTPKAIISKTIGRDASEVLKRNVPQFEDAVVEMRNPGLFWMGLKRVDGGRFL